MARRILVADESQNVQRNVKVILSQEGFEVSGVSDMTALEAAVTQFRPHLVLVDVELPPADGYMACRGIKEDAASSDVAVLLMVGTFVVLDRAGMEACRAEGFITKPFDPLALKARVREVMRELEDTHRIKLDSVPRRATAEVLAEVEALSGVPEIAADDFGELQDQDETFPQSEGAESAPAAPDPYADDDAVTREHETGQIATVLEEAPPATRPEPGGAAAPPPRLVAFVQKIRETITAPVEEPLTEAERRIIEDNEAMMRVVSAEPEAEASASSDEANDLSSLVSEADAISDEVAPSSPESTDPIPVQEPPSSVALDDVELPPAHALDPGAEESPESAAGLPSAAAAEEAAPGPILVVVAPAVAVAAAVAAASVATMEDEEVPQLDDEPDEPDEEDEADEADEADGSPSTAHRDEPSSGLPDEAVRFDEAVAPVAGGRNEETAVLSRLAPSSEEPVAPVAAAAPPEPARLANEAELVERIVAEVMRRLSDAVVREIAWEVVPELARLYVEKKLREK